jgi:ketosteroid isomerase-like protein
MTTAENQKTADLPAPVAEFVRAANAFDLAAMTAVFADDALVNDIRREFGGRTAIRRWLEREIAGVKVTMDVTAVREHYGTTIAEVRVDGEYDKTGLPDPLILTYYFSVAGDRITQLIIISNQPTPDWAADPAQAASA